jgi:hypothetical protein
LSDNDTAVEPSDSAAAEPTGLLDNVEASEDKAPVDSNETAVDHRAAESIPDDEAVDRPDWWPENFWNKDNNEPDLEGMAKSWKDLRKMVSKGAHKAPPEGKYDISAFGENAENLQFVPMFKDWAAENGVSQAAFDDIAGKLMGLAQEAVGVSDVDIQAERRALGPNADAVINGMVNWARGLVNKGVWSADDFEEFKLMGGTARGLKALSKVREAYEGRIPTDTQPTEGQPTDLELQAMVGDSRWETDPAYRAKVERLFNQRYG